MTILNQVNSHTQIIIIIIMHLFTITKTLYCTSPASFIYSPINSLYKVSFLLLKLLNNCRELINQTIEKNGVSSYNNNNNNNKNGTLSSIQQLFNLRNLIPSPSPKRIRD